MDTQKLNDAIREHETQLKQIQETLQARLQEAQKLQQAVTRLRELALARQGAIQGLQALLAPEGDPECE